MKCLVNVFTLFNFLVTVFRRFTFRSILLLMFVLSAENLRGHTHLKDKKKENSIIIVDETKQDIMDFFSWLFRVFIEEVSILFCSKNIQNWRSYVVFNGSLLTVRSVAVVMI